MSTPLEGMMGEEEPEGETESEPEENGGHDPYEGMAEDLMEAIKDGDAASLASALKAFVAHCDTAPHSEGPHEPGKLHGLLGLSAAHEE
jgi:hypothetical protein